MKQLRLFLLTHVMEWLQPLYPLIRYLKSKKRIVKDKELDVDVKKLRVTFLALAQVVAMILFVGTLHIWMRLGVYSHILILFYYECFFNYTKLFILIN